MSASRQGAEPPREDRTPGESAGGGLTRRGFLKGAGATVAAAGLLGPIALPAAAQETKGVRIVGPQAGEKLAFDINGKSVKLAVPPHTTLLDMLRGQANLTGAKRVCDRGSCGSCAVLIDGVPVNSCCVLAIDAAGRKITTVEGIGDGERLTHLQEAFLECDALQCGFCTPGMVVTCTALLARNAHPTRAEIAEALAGNICRCGTYQNIFEAVERASRGEGGRR